MKEETRKENINKRIIDALFSSISVKSMDEITSDEIAQKANVSKRTLYKYYSGKKQMYLALIKEVFADLSGRITDALKKTDDNNPLAQITCIGREYMSYCINYPVRSKLLINYDETEYSSEYYDLVEAIKMYSNKFELVPYIKRYYETVKIKPPASVESLSLYLWAEAHGMATLLLSKRDWIENYYNLDGHKLIEEHLELSKKILGVEE